MRAAVATLPSTFIIILGFIFILSVNLGLAIIYRYGGCVFFVPNLLGFGVLRVAGKLA